MMKWINHVVTAVVLAMVATTPIESTAQDMRISLRVVEKFRLLERHSDFPRLLQQVRTAPDRAAVARTDSFPSPLGFRYDDVTVFELPVTKWDAAVQRCSTGYARPSTWKVQMTVVGALPTASCEWLIKAMKTTVRGSCANMELEAMQLDEVSVAMTATSSSEPLFISLPIAIEHRLIVVMGDSFASGEGVPDISRRPVTRENGRLDATGDPYWWDQKCHRSLLSAGVQSAMRWSAIGNTRSTTVLSYACSGAEIGSTREVIATDRGGILSPYVGRETRMQLRARKQGSAAAYGNNRYNVNIQYSDSEPLESQLNQAIRDLCDGRVDKSNGIWGCDGNLVRPDLVLLSVGGNDVGFGEIIRRSVGGRCDAKCIEEIVNPRFAMLPSRYAEMADAFRDALKPVRVLMLDYGDPTRDQDGNFCKHDGSPASASRGTGIPVLNISADEYRLAAEKVVQPLNAAGRKLASERAKEGWSHLNVMAKATNRKGICSKTTWFTSSYGALMKQNLLPDRQFSSGTAHPNIIYHAYQADAIVDWMRRISF